MIGIQSIALESDETGYVLTAKTDFVTFTAALNDLSAMRQLLAVAREVQNYVDSHDEALAAWKARNEDDQFPTLADISVRIGDQLDREGLA